MLLWFRGSLKRILALTFSVIMVLTVVLVASFSYYHTSKTIRQDAEQYSKQILGQANLNLARYYRDNQLFFTTLASSEEFRKWLLTPPLDTYSKVFLMKGLENRYIIPYSTYHPEIISIILYNENGNESIYRSGNPDSEAILMTGYSLRQEAWLQNIQLDGKMTRFVNKPTRYMQEFGRPIVIPVMTFVQKFQERDQSGYLMMDISLQPTQEILDAVMKGNHATSMISDGDGTLIASPNSSNIGKQLPDAIRMSVAANDSGHFFAKQTRELVVFETVPGSDWKMIVQIPYDAVARSIFIVRNFTLSVAGLCLLGGLFLVVWVSDSTTRRIQQLRLTMRSTEMGNFHVRAPESGIDEVSGLARSYNRLLERIEESIEQLAESRLVHQKAILSALQSQINSHFLYNALESINSMANIAGHSEIRQTALALSKLLRYTSNYSQTIVTLLDEVNSLNDYIHIITILYGDHITCHVDLPSELQDVQCLKALLQPIVENSVKHGYEKTGEKLAIRIQAEKTMGEYVCVSIEDDGPGIDATKLALLRARLQNKRPEKVFNELERVGLLNSHYRLKMVYADAASGIYIPERDCASGTQVQIIFPCRKEWTIP